AVGVHVHRPRLWCGCVVGAPDRVRVRRGVRARGTGRHRPAASPATRTLIGSRPLPRYNRDMSDKLYKVTFLNAGKVYELYARRITSGALWGFTEVSGLVFDVHDGVVVDPTEERLRDEFGNTRVLHLNRKSTRLNSSHVKISYAVFCLKKKITE